MVREWSAAYPFDKMLVVTYTNRAADELRTGLSAPNVEVGTIHSFLHSFSRSIFSAPEIVSLYLEIYGEAIQSRLTNSKQDARIEESNAGYRERLGQPLDFARISASLKSLHYTQRASNTLYTGGLSHDDLLSFMATCVRRFPALKRRISEKFRRIVIDEYQDTNVDVLDLFLNVVADSDCDLYLFGDRMQQIYESDIVRFRQIVKQFDETDRRVENYRSSPQIVALLNNIYNDQRLRQSTKNVDAKDGPRAHFTSDPERLELALRTESSLTLSVRNASIFASFGASDLYKAVSSLPDHSFGAEHPAAAVLTEPDWDKVPNALMRFTFGLLKIREEYRMNRIGSVIRLVQDHPRDFGSLPLSSHSDKQRIRNELDMLFALLDDETITIQGVLEGFENLGNLSANSVIDFVLDPEYAHLLQIPFEEVWRTYEFNVHPRWSTQHGVKGESHERIIFMAETSRNTPVVHMDSLFSLWPEVAFSLDQLEEFAVNFTRALGELQERIGAEVSRLTAPTYADLSDQIRMAAEALQTEFSASPLFSSLYGSRLRNYLSKSNVSNAKALFKPSGAQGLLAAYKLFYVGCSRARSELDVIIPVREVSDIHASKAKLEQLGFAVTVHA